jgi:NitT/TauT family transport system permease protein
MTLPLWTRRLLFSAALVALWQAVSAAGLIPARVLPSPLQVGHALVSGLTEKGYLGAFLLSARRIAVGYALSILAGVALGTLLAWWRSLHDLVGSALVSLQALPSVCWFPLAFLWFGEGEGAILFVVILGAILSITIATSSGIRNLSPIYLQAARTLGASGFALHRYVTLPAALPSILGGMKLGWAFAWRALMAGEILFATLDRGLGFHLAVGQKAKDMSQILAVMVLIVSLGILVDLLLFGILERRLRERWGLARS